jgi:hypothetical protein
MTSDDTAMALVRESSECGEELDLDVARTVAGWWHDGQFSDFYKFSSSGWFDRDELQRELSRTIEKCYRSTDDDGRLQLDMLGTFFLNYELPPITSVWSSFGHRFMSTDDPDHESCLTCGAMFQLVRRGDDHSAGDYTTASGDAPMTCTGDTGMVHGYPGERYCHEHEDECSHVNHDCNCILCDS